MTVLYRKYRPTQLSDVVGQEHITKTLENVLKQEKPAHAYLFIGPRGTGKTSVARIFAHAVNGFDYQVEDNYLDIIEIDAASNTGVDNIRELREKAIIAPTSGKYKVYIIDEVHMLTKSASNALLKTLEEPPEHVIFIMATTDAHKIPITISSRAQVYTFQLADPEIMFQHLRKIADLEKIPITDDALRVVVRRGGGSFRDSLSLLDQIASLADQSDQSDKGNHGDKSSSGNKKAQDAQERQEITAELLNTALGLPEADTISGLLSAFEIQDVSSIHQLLKTALNSGIKPETLASELITAILENPQPSLLPLLAKLPDVAPPFPEAKLLLAFLDPARQASNSGQNPTLSNQNPNTTTKTRPKGQSPTLNNPSAASGELPSMNDSVSENPPKSPALSFKEKIARKKAARAAAEKAEIALEAASNSSNASSENSANPADLASKTPENAPPAPKIAKPAKSEPFNWDGFINSFQENEVGIYNLLQKVDFEYDGQTLHLYPFQKITKNILEKPANQSAIANHLDHVAFLIHNPGDPHGPEDATINQISAIMGSIQEVKTGEMPF